MDPNDPNENDRDNEEAELEHCVNNNIESEECDICLVVPVAQPLGSLLMVIMLGLPKDGDGVKVISGQKDGVTIGMRSLWSPRNQRLS